MSPHDLILIWGWQSTCESWYITKLLPTLHQKPTRQLSVYQEQIDQNFEKAMYKRDLMKQSSECFLEKRGNQPQILHKGSNLVFLEKCIKTYIWLNDKEKQIGEIKHESLKNTKSRKESEYNAKPVLKKILHKKYGKQCKIWKKK